MSDAHVATVQGLYEAFGRGDLAAILDAMADDVAWDQDGKSWGMPWYEPRQGKQQVAGFFQALAEGVVVHRLEPRNMLTGGDQVAAVLEVELEIKGKGSAGVEQEIHLWTFDATGKVCRFAHVLDRHEQASVFRGTQP